MSEKDIFIGRKDELKVFRENFEKNFSSNKSWNIFKKKEDNNDFYKIFLFYGDGGFGKSTLANAISDEAKTIFKEKAKKTKIIFLDWDDSERKNLFIDSYRTVLDGIYYELIKEDYELRKFFEPYSKMLDKLKDAQKKVEDKQKEPEWMKDFSELATKGIQEGAAFIPQIGDTLKKGMELKPVENLTKATLHYTVGQGVEKYQEWVKRRNILKEDEYLLWVNPEAHLSEVLAKGFREAIEKYTILFIIDTYERVDRFDEEFRSLFLKKLYADNPIGITTIITGRSDLSPKYRNTFSESIFKFRNMEDLLFTESQVLEFSQKKGIQFSESEIKELTEHTKGIPLVVNEVLTHIQTGTIPRDRVFIEIRQRSGGYREVLYGVVDRFIKYCSEEEKKKVYTLSILKEWDYEILEKLWGKEKEVDVALKDLAIRHSFISLGKKELHKTIYEFLRQYLISELDQTKNSTIRTLLHEYGKIASIHWEEKLKEYETKEPAIDERYNDKNFLTFLKNYLNSLAFMDLHRLFQILPGIVLESIQFHLDFGKDILTSMEEFKSVMNSKQQTEWKILQKGLDMFQFISFENAKEKTPDEVIKLLEFLEKNRDKLNEIQKAILEFRHGEILIRNHELEKAFEHFEKHSQSVDKLEKVQYYLSDIYFRLGHLSKNNEQKIIFYTKSINLHNKESASYNNRGIAYANLKDYSKAIDDYTKANELDPKDASAYGNRGNVYYELKDYPKAINDYTKVIELDPKDAKAYYNRGYVYYKLKNYPKAIDDYTKTIELNPKYATAYYNRGNVYYDLKDYPKAIDDYTKVIELDSKNATAYYNRGNAYDDLEDYPKAIDDYTKAIELDPKDASAYYNRGIVYKNLKDYPKAIDDYTKVIELDAKDANAYYNRGNVYYKLKNYPKAIDDYTRTIELDSNYESAYFGRALTYSKIGDYNQSIEDYQKCIELHPSNSNYYSNLAQIFFILNKDNPAIESLEKAFSLNPTEPCLLLELWYYSFAHVPEKREEAKRKLQELIEENLKEKTENQILSDWAFSKNIEKAIRENHPEVDLLKEFAKQITGKEYDEGKLG